MKSALRSLSGSLTNPEATEALEQNKKEDKDDTTQEQENTNDETDNLSLLMKTVNNLYGDIALFSMDDILEDKPEEFAFVSEGDKVMKMQEEIENMHIIDKLNYIKKDMSIDEDDKEHC